MKLNVVCLALAMTICTVANAQEPAAKKKGKQAGRNTPAALVTRQLKDVELTEQQKSKIQSMAKEAMAEMKSIREDAGLTPKLMKQRTEAAKALKDSEKKGDELVKAINEKAGLNEAQAAAFQKLNAVRQKLLKDSVALLTDDQKSKLPKRLVGKGPNGGKGKGKKKKDAA
ncbi:hypothetical protein FYK55_09775 [Roseiconus nitratireducens]|uniref:LTXXQ motif family protein n=1 Tax=Roseiconus nitratireducens TaxID=2605748 RepID=A0A5M6DB44_9BACT|nr:hypothetical protein [Roseiconus nitratireducens]KAA5544593.1 hypothetical protein FYK55_09775 [Roseiconus nitratireducens]